MENHYIKKLDVDIQELISKKSLATELDALGVPVKYINYYKDGSTSALISKDNTTIEGITAVINKYTMIKHRVHGVQEDVPDCYVTVKNSEVLGFYIFIKTKQINFLFKIGSAYRHKEIHDSLNVEKKWSDGKNRNIGEWGIVEYAGGALTLYPRKKYNKNTIIKYLKTIMP